jgi:hypothetical protein
MSIPSNLYSEKIFAEHPLVMWSLDDKSDYISLISESDRDMSLWQLDDCTVEEGVVDENTPFQNSIVNIIGTEAPTTDKKVITLKSDKLFKFNQINTLLGTMSIGMYLNSKSVYLKSVELGYYYYDDTIGVEVEETKTFNYKQFNNWTFISGTFEPPIQNVSARLLLRLTVYGPFRSEELDSSDYQFEVNGLSVGQWSENYQTYSLGVVTQELPENINLKTPLNGLAPNGIQCVPAAAYGSSHSQGYYLALQKSLTAQNTSIPMVYGAENVTKIYPNHTVVEKTNLSDGGDQLTNLWTSIADGGFFNYPLTALPADVDGGGVSFQEIKSYPTKEFPSLIIPGKGFLNNSGQYKTYTFEMWIRLSANNKEPRRIFGPINSTDGIYVEPGIITLVIGENFGSYYVGEWFRPMLMDFTLGKDLATLIINGEEVISISLDTDALDFPAVHVFDEDKGIDVSQDWLGFYAYDDVSPIEIDAVAIYPYKVPINVAKRRFVYGQGVSFPESLTTAYNGQIASIDYPNAGYSSNYNYPDFALWEQGASDNLKTSGLFLETPDYELPFVFVGNGNYNSWLGLNSDIQSDEDIFYTFNVGSALSTSPYIKFDTLSIIGNNISSVYGTFMLESDTSTKQILFKFQNIINNDYFTIRTNSDKIEYVYGVAGIDEVLYTTERFDKPAKFSVGINIPKLVERFGDKLASFFGNFGVISLYVGGNGTQENPNNFKGKIYSIGIDSHFNSKKINDLFNTYGVLEVPKDQDTFDALKNHTASYTLIGILKYGQFFLDIAIAGYWEDYMPLSYFAKYISDPEGNKFYDLDFLQFNIDYPEPTQLLEKEVVGAWTYKDLYDAYKLKTHRNIDNPLITGWDNYEDVQQKSAKYYEYDTSSASVRSFVTLQYVAEGISKLAEEFDVLEPAKEGRLIDIKNYSNWVNTKFEVVNGTLIYPNNALVNFEELAIVYSLEFNVRGIKHNPVKVRKLEWASKSINNSEFNPIGTEFGVDLYPYKQTGIYFDYKSPNPYSICKESSPYLYLTRDSGIELRGDFDPTQTRGISMPVNPSGMTDYTVSAIQLWLRYDNKMFSPFPTKIFEVEHLGGIAEFYMIAESIYGNRSRIYAIDRLTGEAINGVSYYWNGKLVVEPRFNIKEWGVLGISFAKSLDYSNFSGSINVCGPITFNNLSHYRTTKLQELQKIVVRPWLDVLTDRVSELDWQYWQGYEDGLWNDILVLSSTDGYRILPNEIYDTYMGTNKTIVDDNASVVVLMDTVNIFSGASWQTNTYEAL